MSLNHWRQDGSVLSCCLYQILNLSCEYCSWNLESCSWLTGEAPSVVFCCCFTDVHLHSMIVTSGYLNYSCLPINSNQSGHSPLTSDINKAFSPEKLWLAEYFHFFRPFSVNSRDAYLGVSAVFEIVRPAPRTMPHSKSHGARFFLILMLSLNFSRLPWPCGHV